MPSSLIRREVLRGPIRSPSKLGIGVKAFGRVSRLREALIHTAILITMITLVGCGAASRHDLSKPLAGKPAPDSSPAGFATSASEVAPVADAAPAPNLTGSPIGSVDKIDPDQILPQAPTRYTLGPGDVVTVTVWGHPELSGRHTIGPDGNIQLPFVGSIRIANQTANDASAKLTGALREMYSLSVASLTIDTYNGNQIFVFGRVAKPGVMHFADEPTLLEALARAGSVQGQTEVSGMPTRCAIIRGRDRILWVDLRPLLRGQDPSLNLALQRNDVVYVPDADSELVYVMGQVKTPGAYPMTAHMTFLEALTRAGGPDDNAQKKNIMLERPGKSEEEVIDLENFVEKGETDYQLEAGDIVYVPKSGVAKIGYFLQQVNPITTLALFGAAL
jgi:polysaccharide export outer membrane protein